jgi:hypothetical protein
MHSKSCHRCLTQKNRKEIWKEKFQNTNGRNLFTKLHEIHSILLCEKLYKEILEMYNQQYPFYTPNYNQMQVPPCIQNAYRGEMSPSMMQPMQTMPMPVMPEQVLPESTMPEYQLENMYPDVYFIIYPEVVRHCDDFDRACCSMMLPTREEVERMVDNIAMKVEPEVEASMETGMPGDNTRQFGFAGRGLLRNLVGVLLLREFFDRRHRPHRRRRMGY